ncbi:unnamed protein product [Prorocentrum cordatum]|uniref:Uncharacterized protein n=1 Tax=Prorocentrum cordatum TaxID=2364126 RepID=A0ABN9VA35_9DINO|nr:unnamed protein product [Polarella glacialis]
MPGSSAARYPAHAHDLCPMLTLQGSVAHVDMPVESGATMFLPFSHLALSPRLPVLAPRGVQALLRRPPGPAAPRQGRRRLLQPGAAARRRGELDLRRLSHRQPAAGVLGIWSSDGDCNRSRVSLAVYPALIAASRREAWTPQLTANVVAAAAEGYSFPTNLDLDQPSSREGTRGP